METNWNYIISETISSPQELDGSVDTLLSAIYRYFSQYVPMGQRSTTNNLSWFNDDLYKIRSKKPKLYTRKDQKID